MSDQGGLTIFLISTIDLTLNRGDTIHTKTLHDHLNTRFNTYLFAYSRGENTDNQTLAYPEYSIPVKYFRTLSAQLRNFIFIFYMSIKLKPDVFYIRHSPLGLFPPIIAKALRQPIVLELNSILEHDVKSSGSPRWLTTIISLVARINYWAANEIICVSSEIANEVETRYGVDEENVHVIRNGVNIDEFEPKDKFTTRRQLDISPEEKLVIFVGILASWQGVDYLLQAIPSIQQEIDNLSVRIVGDGPMRSELERLSTTLEIGDIVQFEGSVPHQHVSTYINSADLCVVYLTPLAASHSPLKLFEYKACGKPIVASQLSEFEFLEEIGGGVLVPPEQPEALASEISELLSDDKRLSSLGDQGVDYVRENHSWEGVAEQVAEVIQRTR